MCIVLCPMFLPPDGDAFCTGRLAYTFGKTMMANEQNPEGIARSLRKLRPRGIGLRSFLLLIFFATTVAGWGATQATEPALEETPATTPTAAVVPPDSLGRDTPRGTVLGFLAAVQDHNYERSGRYLETETVDNPEELSGQLANILNNSRLRDLSELPDGSSQAGVPRDIERVQTVAMGSDSLNIELRRVTRDQHQVWLFSAQTIEGVPAAYAYLRESSFERSLPSFLTKPLWLLIPAWKYIALALGFVLAFALVYAIRLPLRRMLIRVFPGQSEAHGERLVKRIARPIGILVWLLLTELMVLAFALPLLARELWHGILSKIGVAVIVWVFLAAINVAALAYRWKMEEHGTADVTAVVRLGQRAVNLLCIFLGIVVVLRTVGYDVTAMLAGLGVGGLALAFAAQKTLENVFGGISVILDKPIRVGDDVLVGEKVGKVVDIGLRSTKFRTLDRTIMTVPNGQLSTMTLENLSMRDMMWFHHVLSVRVNGGARDIETLLEALRALLAGDAAVNPPTQRVRLIGLDAQSCSIEMFCHIKTRVSNDFLKTQESLLLRSYSIIEAHGACLASPVKSIQVTQSNREDVAASGPVSGTGPEK